MMRHTRYCTWSEDEEGNYWTTCDNGFVFNDGGPYNNNLKFCGFCGGVLLQKAYKPETTKEADER